MKQFIIHAFSLAALTTAQAAITSTSNGNYTDGSTWDGGNPPTNGEDYIIQHNVEHAANGTYSLAGDSVTINSGYLRFTGNAPSSSASNITVNNLALNGGRLDFRSSNQYARTMNLVSGFNVSTDSQIRIGDGGEQFVMNVSLQGNITGSGNLNFVSNGGNGSDDKMNLNITSANLGYSGNWSINSIDSGYGYLYANSANALGSGSLTLNTRSALVAGATTSLDSLQGVTLTTSTSILQLTNAWVNHAASLNMQAGTLDLADSDSIIGDFSINGNSLAADTYDSAALSALGFGGNFTGTGTITVIPEPSSAVLGSLGIFGILLRRKR
ncbi:PEP-CTERM sorting domain-containing protein [Verrucomicrobiaceae bacterium N1E253]|uniref:PEP-CTERM sorting domain-containing protein n=1 Tax=Oceaniferula marina TaxID=2748318 RepID=A0A851GHH0_9BACT|nr:PEP-CTERM sorting domain-containing protein [Oceaniferula marina]NWK54685.1 PEP-CTERM sorting domain-containing protein [Oceaniferula marina]